LATRIAVARLINRIMGGALVGPWDIGDLDDVTIDAILAFGQDYTKAVEAEREVQRILQKVRDSHPTYRKWLKARH
jgi:hypothetical protein